MPDTIIANSQAEMITKLAERGIKVGRTTLWKWRKVYAPEKFRQIGRTLILNL